MKYLNCYTSLVLLLLSAIVAACSGYKNDSDSHAIAIESETDSVWSYKGYSDSDSTLPFWKEAPDGSVYTMDSIAFDSLYLNGSKIQLSAEAFFKAFPNPSSTTKVDEAVNCNGAPRDITIENKYYPEYRFIKSKGPFLLAGIDLRKGQNSLLMGSRPFGSEMPLSFIQKTFPNSYNWRNYGTNWTISLLGDDISSYNFFVIKDTMSDSYMTVSYTDGFPFYIEFTWDCKYLTN